MTATVGPPPLADEPRRPERRLNGHAADAGGPVADGGNPDVTARELQALRREMARLRLDYAQLRGLLAEMREGGADPAAPPPTEAIVVLEPTPPTEAIVVVRKPGAETARPPRPAPSGVDSDRRSPRPTPSGTRRTSWPASAW